MDFLALDDVLDELDEYHKRCWNVVMHRHLARAWLWRRLEGEHT